MPSDPARPRFSWTSSSGFWPRVESPTSTAPGIFATCAAACCASVVRIRASSPFICTWMDFMAPPKPLVNTETCAPPICFISFRNTSPSSSWLMSRSFLGTSFT